MKFQSIWNMQIYNQKLPTSQNQLISKAKHFHVHLKISPLYFWKSKTGPEAKCFWVKQNVSFGTTNYFPQEYFSSAMELKKQNKNSLIIHTTSTRKKGLQMCQQQQMRAEFKAIRRGWDVELMWRRASFAMNHIISLESHIPLPKLCLLLLCTCCQVRVCDIWWSPPYV